MAVSGISGLNSISTALKSADKVQSGEDGSASFGDFLMAALNKTSDLQVESDQISEDFAAGKVDNIHDVMIASEKADIALQFTMQVRNKILDAYSEIMRMQI